MSKQVWIVTGSIIGIAIIGIAVYFLWIKGEELPGPPDEIVMPDEMVIPKISNIKLVGG